jgi:hypothetical protein
LSSKYTGAGITSHGAQQKFNNRQIRQPEYPDENEYLRVEPNVRIYKCVSTPIFTYTAETRTDATKTKELKLMH